MIYPAAGYALGAAGWDVMAPDPLTYSVILRGVAAVAAASVVLHGISLI